MRQRVRLGITLLIINLFLLDPVLLWLRDKWKGTMLHLGTLVVLLLEWNDLQLILFNRSLEMRQGIKESRLRAGMILMNVDLLLFLWLSWQLCLG
jgi:hypothetical protein